MPTLEWNGEKAEVSLQALFEDVKEKAAEAIKWYEISKKGKKNWSKTIRVTSIVLAALAAIVPTLSDITKDDHSVPLIPAGYTTICLGIAAGLLILDRFFGFSSGWTRYIVAELQLQQLLQEFEIDWELERANWRGGTPSGTQINMMLSKCKTFTTQINTIVRDETNTWVQEFQSTIRYIDETIKIKTSVTQQGAFLLNVSNKEIKNEELELFINDSSAGKFSGNKISKRNMPAGKYEIVVKGKINGNDLEGKKTISIRPGETCDATIKLK